MRARDAVCGSVALFLLLLSGCLAVQNRSTELLLTERDAGRQIELARGQVLVIELESNLTTGYSWALSQLDSKMLQQIGEPQYEATQPEGRPLLGAGGLERFRIKAVGQGQTTLSLAYHRPWEKDVAPVKSFSVELIVR